MFADAHTRRMYLFTSRKMCLNCAMICDFASCTKYMPTLNIMVQEMGHDHFTLIFYNVIQVKVTFGYDFCLVFVIILRVNSIKIKMANRPFNLLSNVSREILYDGKSNFNLKFHLVISFVY